MTWRGLEALAHQIYTELAPGARVVHNDHIVGQAGVSRQIDVSIRATVAGVDLLVIVDTKDLGRPAEIGEVEEFASKVQDVRANKGVLICSGGFTAGAQAAALSRGLELCQVHDATTRDWNLDIKLPMLWVDLVPFVEMSAETHLVAGDRVPSQFTDLVFTIGSDSRRRIKFDTTFLSAWNDGRLPRDIGQRYVLTDAREDVVVHVEDASGGRVARPARNLRIAYTVSRRAYLGHLTPTEFRGIRHVDGRFDLSFINAADLDLTRDPAWPEVDPDNLPIQLGTTVLTSESWVLNGDQVWVSNLQIATVDEPG